MKELFAPSRREFMKTTGFSVAAGLSAVHYAGLARAEDSNDKINVGMIGVGGRGSSLLNWVKKKDNAQIVAVCDVYVRRRKEAAKDAGLDPENEKDCIADYKDLLARKDIDAVVVATPDHWHARIAIDAMNAGKDVYLEKPMTKTVPEAKQVHETVVKTGRVLQVGSQTTSSHQWWLAKKAIQDGMIGKLIMSQGSYHRNNLEGQWNYSIDEGAGPKADGDGYIDWENWLGTAPKLDWDPDRFFRFRKFWDYSGGIATDLFYHVMAPLNICWPEAQFPYRVFGSGGVYVFKDSREVPDTFAFMAEYPGEHQVVLSSSMANDTHIPGLIRGNEGTIMMVPHGQFEGHVDHITVTGQDCHKEEYMKKFGKMETILECNKSQLRNDQDHMDNFLECVKTREKPVLDSLTAYKAMVTIAMSVESFRQGRVLYFDSKNEIVMDSPPQA